jgi:hypothetical protein
MPLRQNLLSEIQSALGGAVTPNLTAQDAASDLFEAYLFGLVIQAAREEGAQVDYQDVHGNRPPQFVFRTSPGQIYSTAHPYTHAILRFPAHASLEAHVGVRVIGKSGVLHECDVLVLDHAEAATCRADRIPPRTASVVLAVECKYYASDLPLHLGRAFMGLSSELKKDDCIFVSNTTSRSVERLLTNTKRLWEREVFPASPGALSRLTGRLRTTFRNYKAGRTQVY